MTEPRGLRHLEAELEALAEQRLLREPSAPVGAGVVVLCSNDYLGYAGEPLRLEEVAGGAGASRLVTGEHPAHAAAERAIASWVGAESALLFSSGYAANVGAIAALAGPGDVVVSDALNHASIIDGCRLSGAAVRVARHLDLENVSAELRSARPARRRWVVTESYFSMDGDCADLVGLRSLCDEHDAALVVDEAHALGVFGPKGAGRCAASQVRPDVLIGTLGKALGLQGAFVAGPSALRSWLWNRSRAFVFSTGLSPALASAAAARTVRAAGDDGGRSALHAYALRLREALRASKACVGGAEVGPILPLVVGDPGRALELSAALRSRGVLVQAIRPPTVPVGSSRLRVTVRANLTAAELERACAALVAVLG